MSAAAGFFGKVSSHGDFLARRLTPAFIAQWDGWLQAAIASSQRRLGEGWLDAYLTSPVWRFALAGGVADAHPWGGVLMPNVDRVGRYFPLTIAAAAPASPLEALELGAAWYDRVEALALSTLDSDFVLATFDAALQALPAAPGAPAGQSAAHGTDAPRWRWPLALPLAAAQPGLHAALAHGLLAGHSLWWTEGSPRIGPSVLACRGLPDPAAVAAMFDGGWQRDAWRQPAAPG